MTTQSNNKNIHKKNLNTAHSESTQVQYRRALPHKKNQQIRSCMYRRPTEKVKGEEMVYKDLSGCAEESIGPVWSPPSSKHSRLNPERVAA